MTDKQAGSSHLKAALAFHVHEEAVWRLHEALCLVLLLLHICWWVQEINIAGQHLHGFTDDGNLAPRPDGSGIAHKTPGDAQCCIASLPLHASEAKNSFNMLAEVGGEEAEGVLGTRTMIAQSSRASFAC